MTLDIPLTVALGTAVAGVGASVGGVFILAGIGWALVALSVPLLLISAVTFRGLLRAEAIE